MFPLRGVILLPRATLPLNVFEPRYLALVDDAFSGDRLIGIVQPQAGAGEEESPAGRAVPLRRVGGVGRLTGFQETDDNRVLVSLTGIARFEIAAERDTDRPYRVCSVAYDRFAGDFRRGEGEENVDREKLLDALKAYLEAKNLGADWEGIDRSPNELLVNSLAMLSPYGPEEKQALLEAETLKQRSEVLMALAQMELAAPDSESGSTIQ